MKFGFQSSISALFVVALCFAEVMHISLASTPSLAGKLYLESKQTREGLIRPSGELKLHSTPAGQRVGGGAKDATESFLHDDFHAHNELKPSASLRLFFIFLISNLYPCQRSCFSNVVRFQFWFLSQ